MAAKVKSFYDVVRNAPRGRWNGIERSYTPEDVLRIRGSLLIEHTLATNGANQLWHLLHTEPYVNSLGAVTGNQAMQMVRAGLKAIYLSGWQVAADGNTGLSMYPDQGIYPANSGPELCRRINNALQRSDQIESVEGGAKRDWFAPIVADAEAGFGGVLNCYEIMKAYIEAGAAGVHFEDQLSSEKKCGHLGGKVLIPTSAFIRNLNSARLAADVAGTPTLVVARTDAESATLTTSDVDERDRRFINYDAGMTPEGFFRLKPGTGLDHCIHRGLSLAPHADLIWWETSTPNLEHAKRFAEALQEQFPDKMMAYNCSPSFNWEQNLSKAEIAKFQRELGAMGYKYQFITLAGFHSLNYGMFQLALGYKSRGMSAFSELQNGEFEACKDGYTAVRHQREVGTGFFDHITMAASGNTASTTALKDSTEAAQFTINPEKMEVPTPPLPKLKPQIAARAFTTAAAAVEEGGSLSLTMRRVPGDEAVLTLPALNFLQQLHSQFEGRRQGLLESRKQQQDRLNSGELPNFRPETADIRNGSWTIRNTPADLADRRVEITGPVDRKMVINALNSGAKTYMADFEDSTTPTWRNLIDGQKNLKDAVRKTIDFQDPKSGKNYALKKDPAVLLVRPRGWHLPEKHVLVNGSPMSGSLFDFGMYFFHNAKELVSTGSGPYFYLPKMQCYEEAQLWDDVFRWAEESMDLPLGTIKATVLIEHITAAFQSDEILHALKDHIVGLNCGRWDYIFSYIKVFQKHAQYLLPDRSQVGMTTPFMRNYALSTIKNCHRRNAHAIGGMAAQIPIKNDPEKNEAAIKMVVLDKERESADGHDGTWVAHPGLVPIAMSAFDNQLGTNPNQVNRQRPDIQPTQAGLLEIPHGTRTEAGLRHIINVTLGYVESWLRGTGCVPLYNLMEDAATAEISRALIWQWIQHGATLEDGRPVTLARVEAIVCEEAAKLGKDQPQNRLGDATSLVMQMLSAPDLPDFLTLSAYENIVKEGL